MCRGSSTYFSMYTSPTPKAASASRCAVFTAFDNSPGARTIRMPRPPPPAVALTMTGIADFLGQLERLLLAVDRAVAAGKNGHAGFFHHAARARLVAHQANHLWVGPDELDVAGLADFREIGAFREESVSGVNRIGAGDFGGADDGRHVQVAVGAARRTDADVLVREAHVERILVGLRIHRDGLDAELAARVDDAQSDFAAIRDQDFLEHMYAGLESRSTSS